MEKDIATLLTQNEYIGSLPQKNDHFEQPSTSFYQTNKRICKKKPPVKKPRAEAVKKMDENNEVNCVEVDDLSAAQALDINNLNDDLLDSSFQDENVILHLVLSKILDKKKMELLNRDSVRHSLMKRRHYPAKE